MLKFTFFMIAKIVLLILSPIINLLIVMFSEMRYGPDDNGNRISDTPLPYAPKWLAWASTDTDNSLYGDKGWQTIHTVDMGIDYKSLKAMYLWLMRNPMSGLDWGLFSAPVDLSKLKLVYGPQSLEHSRGQTGSMYIKMGSYFQFKMIKRWWFSDLYGFNIQFGWILDTYLSSNYVASTEVAPYKMTIRVKVKIPQQQ